MKLKAMDDPTWAAPTAGHIKAKDARNFIRYTVYKNKNDELVIVDGTAKECAEAIGCSLDSFYTMVSNERTGKVKKWKIITRYEDGGHRMHWQVPDTSGKRN